MQAQRVLLKRGSGGRGGLGIRLVLAATALFVIASGCSEHPPPATGSAGKVADALPPQPTATALATHSSTAKATATAAALPNGLVKTPRGETLHIAVVFDKARYFLGENALVHYVVTNRGTKPAIIGFGGDYRGATRATRYRVKVTAPDGSTVRDPDPSGFNMGGLGGDHELAPGEQFVNSLALMRYADIAQPGRYSVRVAHDLGWTPSGEGAIADNDPRWASTTIEWIAPDAAQAQAVLDAMLAIKPNDGYSVGERRAPYRDFATLTHPRYLPLLHKRASAGEPSFIAGIAAMPTQTATDTLIALSSHPNTAVAIDAQKALLQRMPFGPPPSQTGRGPFAQRRTYLASKAWHPRLHPPPARKLAQRLITSPDPQHLQLGAAIYESVGGKQDFALVLRALDTALAKSDARGATAHYPHPATPHGSLIRLTEVLIAQGATVTSKPTTPAAIAAYLLKWGASSNRPNGYDQRAAQWLGHPIGYVRELALTRTSLPLPPPMQDALPTLLNSRQLSLQVHAANAIASLKQPRFASAVAVQMKTAEDEWLLRSLEQAALASDTPRDAVMMAWAQRLDTPPMALKLFKQLAGLFRQNGGSGFLEVKDPTEAARLKRAWTQFIQKHAIAIRRGDVFELTGPEFTPQLLLKGMELHSN